MDGLTGAQGVKEGYRRSLPVPSRMPAPGSVAIPIPFVSYPAPPPPAAAPGLTHQEFPEPRDPIQYTEELESNIGHNKRESHGYDYSNPYEGSGRRGSPSIGPWESASQRSEVASSLAGFNNPHPLPPGTSVPLSGDLSSSRHLRNKPSLAPTGLSYIDEEGTYYHSESRIPASMLFSNLDRGEDLEMRGLVSGAGAMGGGGYEDDMGRKIHFPEYESSPHPFPPLQPSEKGQWKETNGMYSLLLFPLGLDRLLALFGSDAGNLPLEQAIERKKRGVGGQRWPFATYILVISEC